MLKTCRVLNTLRRCKDEAVVTLDGEPPQIAKAERLLTSRGDSVVVFKVRWSD